MNMTFRRAGALVVIGIALVFPFWAVAATVTMSGTVTNAQTGAPIANVPLGGVRVSSLTAGDPGALVPVEVTGITNASGVFSISINSAFPGLDRVLVFTRSPVSVFTNRIYDGAAYPGERPTYADTQRDGVVEIDFRSDVSGVNFSLEPAVSPVTTYMVEMSDGVRLATDVHLPEGTGPWPTVLFRTPYDKSANFPGSQWLREGYAVVAQDCRGTYASEGDFRGFLDDGWGENKDGHETVLWILDQPWSDGKIGTLGGSANGITQNMLAGSVPPGLVCQWISVAPADLYSQALFHDGAFRRNLCTNWMAGRGESALELLLDELTSRPMYDDAFWGYLNFETRHHLVNWPIVHRGGWYDLYIRGTINNFTGIQRHGGPGARGKQRLVIEAYGHGRGNGGFRWPEDSTQPPAKYVNQVRWFNHWIKGVENGVTDEPPVCYYVLGDVDDPDAPGNEWRFADDWPVPATEVAFYLHEGGLLSVAPPTVESSQQSYVFDPEDPVPTLGGANNFGTKGPYDQRPLESRSDVLVFTTPVLEEYLEITGKVVVRLYASSSAVDTDFTAKLCDVYPDGRSMLVCDGIVRARHRNTMRSEEFIVPGEVYEFEIDLWETCIAFNAGHRVRVSISSSNYDRYDVNPNTGEPFGKHTQMVPATNTIYHDATRPSHVLFRVTGPLPPGIPDPPEDPDDPEDPEDPDDPDPPEEPPGPEPPALVPADVNGDGQINVLDLQMVILTILGHSYSPRADVNGDGRVDAIDVQQVIRAILGI